MDSASIVRTRTLPAMMIGYVPNGFQRIDLLIVIITDGPDALLVFVVEKDVLRTKRAVLGRLSTTMFLPFRTVDSNRAMTSCRSCRSSPPLSRMQTSAVSTVRKE